jgi:hypothetical protein
MLLVGQCTTISLLVYSHTNCLVLFSHQTGRCNAIQKEIKKKKKKGTNLTTSRAPRLSSLLTHQSRSSVRAITAYRPPLFLSSRASFLSLSLLGALPRPSPLPPPPSFRHCLLAGYIGRHWIGKGGSQRVLNPFKTPPFSALLLPLFPLPPPFIGSNVPRSLPCVASWYTEARGFLTWERRRAGVSDLSGGSGAVSS